MKAITYSGMTVEEREGDAMHLWWWTYEHGRCDAFVVVDT